MTKKFVQIETEYTQRNKSYFIHQSATFTDVQAWTKVFAHPNYRYFKLFKLRKTKSCDKSQEVVVKRERQSSRLW